MIVIQPFEVKSNLQAHDVALYHMMSRLNHGG